MMSYDLERAAMKGRLAEMQQQRDRLVLKGQGLCTAVRQGLNTVLTPFDELEIPQVASQVDDLVLAWAELQKLKSDINRTEKALR
jgi:hypothetical protein